MTKKKEIKKKVVEERRISKTVYRCNQCGKVNDTKECCPGNKNDYTQQVT